MKTRAAVLWGHGEDWRIEEVDLGQPGPTEVVVETAYAGLCHCDEHLVTGDFAPPDDILALVGAPYFLPMIGGHEGSGVVVEVAPDVSTLAVGDHVACSSVPSCGRCRWCATDRGHLCDLGARALAGGMIADGVYKHRANGRELNRSSQLGTFSEHMLVDEASVIRVDPDLPLAAVCLVSCAGATGVGAAQNRARVSPGDTVVVVGIGGVGANALQGARLNGATNLIAIDTNPDRRAPAEELGATHFFTNFEDAMVEVLDLTDGFMADSCILAPGVATGDLLDPAVSIVSKDGTVVVAGFAPMYQREADLDLFSLAMYEKQIKGSVFGSASPRSEIPRLLDEYRRGALELDGLITGTYCLDEINRGYEDLRDGETLRGVIAF